MALSNWDTLCFNHKGEVCEGKFTSPMGIIVEVYKNWLHIKDEYAHRENPHVMSKPVIAKIETGELRYMDVSIKCEFQSNFDDSSDDPEDWHSDCNRILYCIWNSYDGEPDFTGICGVACMADMDSNDIEALKIFLQDKDKDIYSNIPKRFKNIDLSKGKRYNQGDAYFHDVLGTDRQCTPVGESKDTIFSQIFNNNKDL